MTEEHQDMIEDCIKRESRLTEWELEFIQSINETVLSKSLTEKQIEKLEKVWERIT